MWPRKGRGAMGTSVGPDLHGQLDRVTRQLAAEFAGLFSQRDDCPLRRRIGRIAVARGDGSAVHSDLRRRARPGAPPSARAGRCPDRHGGSRSAVRLRSQRRAQPDGGDSPQPPCPGTAHARSAGSLPADQLNPAVVTAMSELGLDLSEAFPKPLTDEVVQAADVVVTMGCGDACPLLPGKQYLDWSVPDPMGQSLDRVRAIRDEIRASAC